MKFNPVRRLLDQLMAKSCGYRIPGRKILTERMKEENSPCRRNRRLRSRGRDLQGTADKSRQCDTGRQCGAMPYHQMGHARMAAHARQHERREIAGSTRTERHFSAVR